MSDIKQMLDAFMDEAVNLAEQGVLRGDGGPFGAVVVNGGIVLGRGWNRVVADRDPTAHAEMVAIRDACARLGRFHLQGCVLITTCEPCPMCQAAALWAHLERVIYAAGAGDATAIGFEDQSIRAELIGEGVPRLPMRQLGRDRALAVFRLWQGSNKRVDY